MVDHCLLLDFLNEHVRRLHVVSLVDDLGMLLELLHLLRLPEQIFLVLLMSWGNFKGDACSLRHVKVHLFRSSRRCHFG